MKTIEQQVVELVQEHSAVKGIDITGDTRLFEDLGYDSIAVIRLLVAAEELFGFESNDFDECVEAFENVSSFTSFIRERVEHAADKN